MTEMMEKAFAEAAKLPTIEQNALARRVLEEIRPERKWDAFFAESEEVLARLTVEALEEEEKEKTTEMLEHRYGSGISIRYYRACSGVRRLVACGMDG